jgi:hypothetical protein
VDHRHRHPADHGRQRVGRQPHDLGALAPLDRAGRGRRPADVCAWRWSRR